MAGNAIAILCAKPHLLFVTFAVTVVCAPCIPDANACHTIDGNVGLQAPGCRLRRLPLRSLKNVTSSLLSFQVNANQAELQELEATEQHLKRQQASLTDRLSRLENQSALKREAAVSAVEEQLKEREAIEAENAAARAKIAENEAMVCAAFRSLSLL